MAQIQELHTEADFEAMLEASRERPVVLFKHSVACGVSAWRRREMDALEEETEIPLYLVTVQRTRALSGLIAERLGVRHETPQALVVRNGAAVYHASHGRISAGALREAAAEAETNA